MIIKFGILIALIIGALLFVGVKTRYGSCKIIKREIKTSSCLKYLFPQGVNQPCLVLSLNVKAGYPSIS